MRIHLVNIVANPEHHRGPAIQTRLPWPIALKKIKGPNVDALFRQA